MSAVAMQTVALGRNKACWLGTPEIYFRKTIDNSRLVKVEDPRRGREMRQFGIALCLLFVLVMGYALQHFRAIEYGYKIETLRDPERIDVMARKLGLQSPRPGQVVRMDSASDMAAPVMASVRPVSVVSAR